jgi:hypothetical protein
MDREGMTMHTLYRGAWPQNVSKLAKYSVRMVNGDWKVTVLYQAGEGLRYLAVDGAGTDLVRKINNLKSEFTSQPGGTFYVNEYRHILVPVSGGNGSGSGSVYYSAGRLYADLNFEFEGRPLTTKPVGSDGEALDPGDRWVGPRPGIPYVLAAGGCDIYYERPALTEDDPPSVRPMMTQRIQLSRVLENREAVSRTTRPLEQIRGHQGGRFYVNEHGAMFTPVGAGDGNGLDYIYCGQIDRAAWFPEPPV